MKYLQANQAWLLDSDLAIGRPSCWLTLRALRVLGCIPERHR